MGFSRAVIVNFFILAFIGILSYICTLLFINVSHFDVLMLVEYKNSFLIQTLIMFPIFTLLCLMFIGYKMRNKKVMIKETSLSNDIINENRRLKSSLTIDLLTNLVNKKEFDKRLEEEIKRAIREESTLSFMIVDIDEFGSFIDIYGENEANECIKLIANILVGQCNRPCDLIGRVDDDEFFVLLPNTEDAKTVSKKCVKAVQAMQIMHENSIASNVVTISVGTSTLLPETLEQKEQLLEMAKASLQKAKREGRNRVA